MHRRLRIVPLAALTFLGIGCSGTASEREPAGSEKGRVVLPNWATDEELAIEREAAARAASPSEVQSALSAEAAPPAGYRVPAEYEPVSTVLMTWAGHTDVLQGIAVAAAKAGANVWMVGGPSSIGGVPSEKYRALDFAYDSIWSRDYGPVGINEATNALGIVDTKYRHYAVRQADDAMSCKFATELGSQCYTTSLILDGGNYMTDGQGNAFLTRRVYEWNSSLSKDQVDALLKSYLGVKTIHVLNYAATNGQPADGTGHIDMFAKLVGDCNVLVAQTTTEPFKKATDDAAAYFSQLACGGGTYRVTRVKGWVSDGTWYTYTNSLIVNKTAIIPFYDQSAENDTATRAYESALPGYTIVGVNSEETIVEGGSIHCITKEIPKLPAR